MTTVNVFAPAKINLTLHVTGRREDGYHLLDSLVAFAPVGDQITMHDALALSLTVEGPEAEGVPADMDNLALRAVEQIAGGRGAALALEKYLPVASGIGGGSADAAAAFRGMLVLDDAENNIADTSADSLWESPGILLETQARGLLELGADIPMCLASRPCRVRGIGEKIVFVTLPPVHAVLVNPRTPVPTRDVFQVLRSSQNAPMPSELPNFDDSASLIRWLSMCRNDLQAPALEVFPAIGRVLDAITSQDGCGLARMSGAGATCFGLFNSEGDAKIAAERLAETYPEWWVVGCVLGDQFSRAMPVVS